ncbi:MAG: hypothetical protein J6X60_11855 [Ruminiclostridium sp.]|nr:hypothetical protein [Ruminiclostridium sp.]
MIRFYSENGALTARLKNETLRIEGWGKDALRVTAAKLPHIPSALHALTEPVTHSAEITVGTDSAVIENGDIKATVNEAGVIAFYRPGKLILQEYYSFYGG